MISDKINIKIENKRLKEKIHYLTQELKKKDDEIASLNKINSEKEVLINSLLKTMKKVQLSNM